MEHVDPGWVANNVQSGLSSGEGLLWAVRDTIHKREAIKERNRPIRYEQVVADPGVADKRLMVVEKEFAQTLRVLRREGNTLSPVVREIWDVGNVQILTKNTPARTTGAHVSIVGHITVTELIRYLSESEMFNGFANRFLWVCVRRAQLLPDGGGALDLTSLARRLAAALNHARGVGLMSRTPAAARRWRSAYGDLTSERPGLHGAVTSRAEAQVLRLSMLFALLDSQAVIDVPHLEAALALWAYCQESARLIFGSGDANTDDPLEVLILQLVRAAPAGMTRTDIHRALSGHTPAQVLLKALAGLRDKNHLVARYENTGGRRAERWFARRDCAESERCAETPTDPAESEDSAGNPHSTQLPPASNTEVFYP
jgi:hypothetical protein